MLRVFVLAAPLLALGAPPVAAESAKASVSVSVTIVPFESPDSQEADSEEAEQTTLTQVTRAPVLSPTPAPKEK